MVQSFLNNLLNRQQTPYITPIQMGADGKEDVAASLALENETKPLTLKDRLIGRELYKDVDVQGTPDENGQVEVSTQRYSNFRPGLLNDLASGYRENYVTGFAAPNLGQQQTADGRQKGFGYRLGEGLGSVGRFIDSPLGRGLIAAGLNKALGYDNSLQEGLTAAVGRQNAQTTDKLYRQQLMRDYGYTPQDLEGIKGNIDSKTFNDLTKSQNSAANLEIRRQTAESMNKLRELQAEKQRIINSNLPEQEKAKTLKMITDAEYAEQMNLAKINYFNNAAMNPLGWANFGLKQEESERKNKELEAKIAALEKLTGGGGETTPSPKGGTTKSGNKWKEVN